MAIRNSTTTDKAFQHLKAPPVITKSLKWWELTFETFGEIFQCFAKKCKTYAL